MKRIFSLAMIIALALCSIVTLASASDNAFIASPSAVAAPILVEFDAESDKCEAEIIICAYGDRAQLDAAARVELEEAYATIVATANVLEICPDLEKLGYSADVLAVSDLFEIYYNNCDDHEGHEVTITLRPRVAENFVAVLHYINDEWVTVDNARVEKNGTDLTFEVDSLSPFAIVLHDGTTTPDAPSSFSLPLLLALILLAIIIIIIIIIILSKKKAEKAPEEKPEQSSEEK